MATSNLDSSEERIYGWKLMRLIVDGGTEALRNIFLNIHSGELHHVLANHHSTLFPLYNPRRIITQSQWDKLYPHPPRIPNIQEFDITLLVVLLRNLCGLSAPSTGWNDMPSSTDKSREANIVRIKLFRNSFSAHVPGTAVSRLDFEARWVEVSSTLLGLGLSQQEIDRLKAEECGEEEVNRVRERWNESERETVLELERITTRLDRLEKMLEEVHIFSHESSKQMKSSSDNILSEKLHWCDFENEIQLLLERYTKCTRKWVFEQVLTWLDNKSSPNRAFIIAGQAGMGKSVIAAVICKLFLENFAACHFFQYNNSRYNNSTFFLQSLAWQLSKVFPEYKVELTTNLTGCKGQILSDMNIEALFSLLFKEPLTRCIADRMPFLIVIDALDECRQEDRYMLVDLIAKHFHKLPGYIRFLITTRPEKDIVRKFQTLNPIHLEPDEERNINDLRIFFEKKIETKTEILVKNLVKKSEGLMLFASFIAKIFEDNFSISNTDSLPKGIEEIYESFFKRLENELKILSIEENKFFLLLSVVAFAKRPLPLPFFEKLLCPEKDSLSARRMLLQIINCVSSLLVVKNDCISVFHKSVRDWLVKPDHYFTVNETFGHKTLADICVNQMQTLKQNEVRFTYDPEIDYALRHAIPHILEAEIKDERALPKLIDNVIDLEIVHSSVSVDVYTTLKSFVNLTSWNMYDRLGQSSRATIIMLVRVLEKFHDILEVTRHSFLQHVVNEKIEELSTKASNLLMTRYKELAYFESDDVEEKALIGRIITVRKVLEVDISPSEDFVICGYQEKGIELFSLSDLKSLWKIDDFVVERNFSRLKCNIVLRCIVFHPFLNIIFPGQLDPILNLKGEYESGPITCKSVFKKFTCSCFSHDHTKMVTNYKDHLIVWNLHDNEKVVTLRNDSMLRSILFSGNDRYLATIADFFASSFTVYDTEDNYSMISHGFYGCWPFLVSTFKFDSWYCSVNVDRSGVIVRYDQTKQFVDRRNLFCPCNERATIKFQEIIESESLLWFKKLGSVGKFFILSNGNVLFFNSDDGYDLKIFQINENQQEYDKWTFPLREPLYVCEESAIFSVNGRYIYTDSPYIGLSVTMHSSIQPGKSWKLVQVKYTPFLPVTNGVFLIKREKGRVKFDGGTPELWNADLTKRLFNFPELAGTFHCLSVTENLVACIMTSEVRFFNVVQKEIVARTQLPQYSFLFSTNNFCNVIACGIQYHVVYHRNDENTLLLQKTNVIDLNRSVLTKLKPIMKYTHVACFSLCGGLLAISTNGGPSKSIHILEISTNEIRCNIPLGMFKVSSAQFFNEEHLLCLASKEFMSNQSLFLINVKTGDVLTGIHVGTKCWEDRRFSVCRKTGDIVVLNQDRKTVKLCKLWLPHQRK